MANISLRAYRREIEDLIGHGRIDEVIAHCRHLLKFYPKDVAVYRLLAKAYLESQRYSDATDIFQRVLSVVPDDFVAHVGMSIIREDEGNMDASIWHMERAFESQPSNSAIRDELRRLFGKRDGMEPPKIRLTRGALARMYAQGNLYQQSIGELRAALADDPQRFDLQVLLARMYYMNGQRVEAAETSNALISKLPFCLDANRILAEILYDSDRASEAEVYHQRVKVIDPYAAHATPDNLSTDDVPEDTVTLMRLDWLPGQELNELDSRPGWAASLGLDLGGRGSGTDALPDWLTDEDEEEAEFMTDDSADTDFFSFEEEDTKPELVASSEEAPEASMDFRDTLPPEAGPPEKSAAEADELIPEWMKDAGWATSTGEAAEQAPIFGDDDGLAGTEDTEAIASAEIPDWLQDIAPADSSRGGEPVIEADDDEMSGEIPSWLSSRPPGPTDSVVMWLQNKPEEEDLPPTTGDLEGPEVPEEEVPDWLQSVAASLPAVPSSPEEIEFVDETEEMPFPDQLDMTVGGEAYAEDKADGEEEGALDWMAAVEAPAPDTIEDTKPRMLTTDLEEDLEEMTERAFEAMEEPATLSEEEFEGDIAGEITAVFVPDEAEPALEEAAEPAGMFDETIIAEQKYEAAAPAEPAEDIPDWLREMEDEVLVDEPSVDQARAETGEGEALPAWLRGLEGEPPAAEPDFEMAGEEEMESLAVQAPPASTMAEEEVPDWLREMEATTPSVEAPSLEGIGSPLPFNAAETPFEEPAVEEAAPAEPVPDWLAGDLTAGQRTEGETQPSGVDEEDLETAFSGGLPSLDDQDAAIAWLESLAAKQGVAEEEFVTDPEDRRETPPSWVTDSMTGLEDFEAATSEEEAEIESVVHEPLPDQPDWMTETLIGDTLVADRDEVFDAIQGAFEEPTLEEEAFEEPAVEEWSLDTIEKTPEAEAYHPPETRRLEPEAFGLPPMPDFGVEEETEAEGKGFFFEEDFESEAEEDEATEEPTFTTPGMTREFAADELGEVDWLAEAAEEEEAGEEIPGWLGEMADEMEPGEITPQPAMTRELDLERPGETILSEMEEELEEEIPTAAEELEETVPEWMRETGFPEPSPVEEIFESASERSFEEEEEAVPEWMRETGVPSIIFESAAPDEPFMEVESADEEPEPEWMVETALPTDDQGEDQLVAESLEDQGAGLGAQPATEDWMLETALPDELQAVMDKKGVEPLAEEAEKQPAPAYPGPDPDVQFEEMLVEAHSSLTQDEIGPALGKYLRLIRRRRHLDTVIEHLQDAIYRHPVNTDILETLGDAYVKSNRLQDALDTYSKAEDLLRS